MNLTGTTKKIKSLAQVFLKNNSKFKKQKNS